MIATRAECGTNHGIRWHASKDEPLCDLCADHAAERRLAAELRYVPQPGPVNPDLQQLIHVLAQALNDHHRKAKP